MSLYAALEKTVDKAEDQEKPQIPPKVTVPTGWAPQTRLIQPVIVKRKPPPPKPRVLQNVAKWAHAAATIVSDPKPVYDPPGTSEVKDEDERRQMSQYEQKKKQRKLADQSPALEDVYEPIKPNDYYAFKAESKRRKEEERQSKLAEILRIDERRPGEDLSPKRLHSRINSPADEEGDRVRHHLAETFAHGRDAMDVSGEDAYMKRAGMVSAQPMPAQTQTHIADMSGEEAYLRRAAMSCGSHVQPHDQAAGGPVPANMSGEDAYCRRVGLSGGNQGPTRVVLLTNMVGAGEVDGELQQETADECGRFGKVETCVVYEVPYKCPDEEAVRIFIEFSDIDAAIRAQGDLNGRFFGGRVVRAAFYDVGRYQRKQYVV